MWTVSYVLKKGKEYHCFDALFDFYLGLPSTYWWLKQSCNENQALETACACDRGSPYHWQWHSQEDDSKRTLEPWIAT